jgi:pimeloyl-ACP methyl ester carboxylesterase
MTAFEDLAPRRGAASAGRDPLPRAGHRRADRAAPGLLTNSLLWADVASALAKDFRVIAPDWRLSSHERPLRPGTDLPPLFRPPQLLVRIPGSAWLIANALRPRGAQPLPMTVGGLSKRPLEPRVVQALLRAAQSDRRIRRELAAVLRAISNRYTLNAAERFRELDKPVLIAWAPEDRPFPFRHAERMADAFPNARLERIEESHTFVSIDQPGRTADLIASFARGPVAA